jgi:aquaporin Z
MTQSLLIKALAEMLGTFILVAAVISAVVGGSALGPVSVAAALMIGVYCVGDVSGGHLNPAVSFGVFLAGLCGHVKFSIVEFGVYFLAQLVGATAAVFKTTFVFTTTAGGPTSTISGQDGALAGGLEHPFQGKILGTNITNSVATAGGLASVGLAELVFTAVLVFVVLNVATCGDEGKAKNNYFGLAIGFVLAAGACAVGGISMCCLNPAVAWGLAIAGVAFGNLPDNAPEGEYDKGWPFLMFFYYTLMELLGAVVALVFFYLCRKHQVGAKGEPDMISKFVFEFLGTFVLCLTVMLSIHGGSSVMAIGIASSLMVMIYAGGPVSGGNFNPAVSFGILVVMIVRSLCRGIVDAGEAIVTFIVYVIAQVLGAFAALFVSWAILRRIDVVLIGKDLPSDKSVTHAASGSLMGLLGSEAIFTFLLVFTVLNVAVRQSPPFHQANQFYGLAIGFVIIVAASSTGSISGAVLNPAVALMLDFGGKINGHGALGYGFLYALVQLFAGLAAAIWFMIISSYDDTDYQEDYKEMYVTDEETDELEDSESVVE